MTIGQYIPGQSWLHQLDPRVKMLSLILLLVSIFLIPIQGTIVDLSILAGYFVFTLLLVVSSGIPLLKVLQGLRPILFLLTFTVLIQILIIRPTTLVAISDTFTFHLSFTSLAAIILWIIFYQITKKWIKFKVLYFIFSVISYRFIAFSSFFQY